jgi:hypothetical protein
LSRTRETAEPDLLHGLPPKKWVHSDRTVGGDRNHRDIGGTAAAEPFVRKVKAPPLGLLE